MTPGPGRGSRWSAADARPRRVRLLLLVPAAFLTLVFVAPVLAVVLTGLRSGGTWDPGGTWRLLSDPALRSTAWFTLWQAAASTALTLAVALPGAFVLARFDFPGRGLLGSAVLVPFVLPTVVVGTAFLALVGPRGSASTLGHGVGDPRGARVLQLGGRRAHRGRPLARHRPPRRGRRARLGAPPWRRSARSPGRWCDRPGGVVRASCSCSRSPPSASCRCSAGPTRTTLEMRISPRPWRLVRPARGRGARARAVAQWWRSSSCVRRAQRLATSAPSRRTRWLPARRGARRPRDGGEPRAVAGDVVVVALLLGGPLLVLVRRSLPSAGGWPAGDYRALGTDTGSTRRHRRVDAVRNSLGYAAAAVVIAVVVGGCAACRSPRRGAGRWMRSTHAAAAAARDLGRHRRLRACSSLFSSDAVRPSRGS